MENSNFIIRNFETLISSVINLSTKQIAKAALIYALLFITGSLSSFAQGGSWVQKSDFGYNDTNVKAPTLRTRAVGFSIGSKGYVGTGMDAGYQGTKDFWEYDPVNNTWTQKADFGGGNRSSAVGFSIGSKGYLGTGGAADFWEYDPAANNWTQKANFGGGARSDAVGFSIGSKGYLGTGNTSDFWEYDPATDKWTKKADFAGSVRTNAVGFSIGSKGYLGTGANGITTLDDFWEYDPITNTWTRKADFAGTRRGWAVGFSISGKGYLGTGLYENNYDGYGFWISDFWEYDPGNNIWVQKADFNGGALWWGTGFSIGNKGYLGTGYKDLVPYGVFAREFSEFDPVANTWVAKAGFGGTDRSYATGFSIGNKGYLGTGGDGNNAYKDFWEYNPLNNAWAQKADFGGAARMDAVGFSIGRKGYIGTGVTGSYPHISWVKDFWEYDPAANTWTQKADFGGNGREGAAGFSIGSKGYLGTGYAAPYNEDFYKDFWEYDPATNTWTQKADFGGTARYAPVGFGISSKGYLGTGQEAGTYNETKDFWQYDPVTDTWTQKADFGGGARSLGVGFSTQSRGYLGTGSYTNKDFWEYDPTSNTWTQKADFGGSGRQAAVGFSIGNKGYLGTGGSKDFWEYTTVCSAPSNLRVPKVTDTAALLKWTIPASSVSSFRLRYRTAGSIDFKIRTLKGSSNNVGLPGLLPNTTYQWQMKSNCTADTSGWVSGPDFTTTSSLAFSSNADAVKINNASVQIMPNPSKGNITVAYYSSNSTALQLNIFYITGKKVFTKTVKAIAGKNTYQLNLSTLATGTFYLQIINGSETKNIKFVIEK